MSGYKTPTGDGLGPLIAELETIKERLATLEIPTGTSVNSLVAQVQEAIAQIGTTVDAWLDANLAAVVGPMIANPGNIAPANVTISGELRAPNVPVTILTSAYFATYASTSDGGRIGHVPSSLIYKTITGQYMVDLEKWIGLAEKLRWYYYNEDEQQSPRAGQIAEWVNEDFPEFVIHEDGEPRGIHYEFMISGQISAFAQFVDETRSHAEAQDVEIAELRARLDAAGL